MKYPMNAMDEIPYEENSFYIFDCGYNDFKRLHNNERSIYEMFHTVSISLTGATPFRDLFEKPNYSIINELDGYTEPTLFNC